MLVVVVVHGTMYYNGVEDHATVSYEFLLGDIATTDIPNTVTWLTVPCLVELLTMSFATLIFAILLPLYYYS